MEENQEIINFVGYMKLSGNDKDLKVYFDSEDEKDMIDSGFFYFILKDYKDKVEYLLANPELGHIRTIRYEKE